MSVLRAICVWCGEPLHYENGRGWVHRDGGLYMQQCRNCGWLDAPYPSLTRCPGCDAGPVVDDHCALPMPDTLERAQVIDAVSARRAR